MKFIDDTAPTTWTNYGISKYGKLEGKFSGGEFELLKKINLNSK